MPSIIARPENTRETTRGLSQADTQTYIDLMLDLSEGEMVHVDDAKRNTRDRTYARAERVRFAAIKYDVVPEGKLVSIVVYKTEDNMFDAGVFLKDDENYEAPEAPAEDDEDAGDGDETPAESNETPAETPAPAS